MKRQALVEYEDASPGVQAIYDESMAVMGTPAPANYLKALGHHEPALNALWAVTKHTVFEGEIPLLLKNLILFTISIRVGNKYCQSFHGHAALSLDRTLSYDELITLAEGKESTNLPASFQVALDVVTRATLQPKSVADPDFDFEDQLRDEGFSEAEINELTAQGYFAMMMNMHIDCFDIPWDRPFPPETK